MKAAKGEYFIFCDPDDYIDDKYIATILNAVKEYNKPDMIVFDYYTVNIKDKRKLENIPIFNEGIVNKKQFYVRIS